MRGHLDWTIARRRDSRDSGMEVVFLASSAPCRPNYCYHNTLSGKRTKRRTINVDSERQNSPPRLTQPGAIYTSHCVSDLGTSVGWELLCLEQLEGLCAIYNLRMLLVCLWGLPIPERRGGHCASKNISY